MQVFCKKKGFMNILIHKPLIVKWAHLGMIQGPPDYERDFWPFSTLNQPYLNWLKSFTSKAFNEMFIS